MTQALISNNGDLSLQLLEYLRLQGFQGQVNSVSPVVVPTVNYGPSVSNIVKSITSSATGNTTVYTVPANKIFFLTGVNMSVQQDATCDCLGHNLQFNTSANSAFQTLIGTAQLTTTASRSDMALALPFPLRVPAGSLFRMSAAYTLGTATKQAVIIGFEVGMQ